MCWTPLFRSLHCLVSFVSNSPCIRAWALLTGDLWGLLSIKSPDQVRLTTVPVRATPAPQYYRFHWSVPGDIILHWRSVWVCLLQGREKYSHTAPQSKFESRQSALFSRPDRVFLLSSIQEEFSRSSKHSRSITSHQTGIPIPVWSLLTAHVFADFCEDVCRSITCVDQSNRIWHRMMIVGYLCWKLRLLVHPARRTVIPANWWHWDS